MNALLPIEDALPALIDALRRRNRAVLQAPPGAGKTTRVPLALLEADLCKGRILMLEPRRLAARAAAERMAETLGEVPGERVGYRMRAAVKSGPETRIEVVTEGILTRMIQSDPELSGIDAVIFDEFHERSLNADLGLALCLEIAGALREDLMLLVMSATLDAAPVAALMGDVPVITSQGRSFPVAFKWLKNPLAKTIRYEAALADLVVRAAAETEGGLLVFLPGEGEIRRVETLLKPRLGPAYSIRPLYGAMPFSDQRTAIQPDHKLRKVVLATAIAETSLTIEDIRVVVDGGRARRARFDAGSGMSRLVTEKVTRAEATQRAGRAGRVSDGTAYRLWTRGEEGGLQAYPPAEIEAADLAPLALELALWGTTATKLPFLTQPNAASLSEAQSLLQLLGALDGTGQMTPHGRKIAALPLHPRLAHMLELAGPQGALLAALLADRDPLARSAPVDLSLRMEALRDLRHYSAALVGCLHMPGQGAPTADGLRCHGIQHHHPVEAGVAMATGQASRQVATVLIPLGGAQGSTPTETRQQPERPESLHGHHPMSQLHCDLSGYGRQQRQHSETSHPPAALQQPGQQTQSEQQHHPGLGVTGEQLSARPVADPAHQGDQKPS